MRRWHLLYTSHGSMAPRTASHLSCLAKARRGLGEYRFYVSLAQRLLGSANDELMRALKAMGQCEFHAFHAWRMARGEPELHLDCVAAWRESNEYKFGHHTSPLPLSPPLRTR